LKPKLRLIKLKFQFRKLVLEWKIKPSKNCLKLKTVLLRAAPKMKKEQASACSFVKSLWKKTVEKYGWTAKKEKEAHLHFQFH